MEIKPANTSNSLASSSCAVMHFRSFVCDRWFGHPTLVNELPQPLQMTMALWKVEVRGEHGSVVMQHLAVV